MGVRAIATSLVLLATVPGTLACEMLTPLSGDGPTVSSESNAPMTVPIAIVDVRKPYWLAPA